VAVAANPKLSLGEAYMDGSLVPLGSSIHDVLAVVLANLWIKPKSPPVSYFRRAAARVWRPVDQFNAAGRARRNVAHHYDLNGELYSLFLDRDRQYSCAYFPKGTETLEEAQTAKTRHIAAKLCLDRPGLSVLDIGCGWGGMALSLARDYGAKVTGITLSTEQLGWAKARAEAEGLWIKFHLSCWIIGQRSAAPTGSCRSACSSMSASSTIAPSLTPSLAA
jgi:cyclopropane-fatty-acyl-phospholipid synthase